MVFSLHILAQTFVPPKHEKQQEGGCRFPCCQTWMLTIMSHFACIVILFYESWSPCNVFFNSLLPSLTAREALVHSQLGPEVPIGRTNV